MKLLDARELSREIGLPAYTILAYARRGVIPVVKLGYRTVRFDLLHVEAALMERELMPFRISAPMRRRRPRVRATMLQRMLQRKRNGNRSNNGNE